MLLDTNILLRLWVPASGRESVSARGAVEHLERQGHTVCLSENNLYEFYAVATRPVEANGFGMEPQKAGEAVYYLRYAFQVLRHLPHVLPVWAEMVVSCGFRGKVSHDARLAAVAIANGVQHILTLNPSDFRRIPGLTVLTPEMVVAS